MKPGQDNDERGNLRMDMKIAVLGTGAIGSCVGADLTRAGHDVLLIDQWPAHVEAMKARGLVVTMPKGRDEIRVQTVHLCEMKALQPSFDLVFLTAKSYDTPWMVEFIRPYLKPTGVLVSVQNSLNDEWIAPVIGYERDIGCVIELSAELYEPGQVKRNTDRERTWYALGELHGRITPRVQEIARILGASGRTGVNQNIWGAKWTKLTVNSMSQAVAGVLGMFEGEIPDHPKLLELCIRLGKEALQVGAALGYCMEPIFGLGPEAFLGTPGEVLETSLKTLLSHIGRRSRNSTLQDHLKGRKSEIDFLNGLVVKKGREAGVQTPLNEAMVALTRQIEQKSLRPDLANLPLLERLLER
jgi:2-dehydropantoate 2-reductase